MELVVSAVPPVIPPCGYPVSDELTVVRGLLEELGGDGGGVVSSQLAVLRCQIAVGSQREDQGEWKDGRGRTTRSRGLLVTTQSEGVYSVASHGPSCD